ncbi:MAG: hypothetical protein AB1333_03115 [Patescibacteria group bacterium]
MKKTTWGIIIIVLMIFVGIFVLRTYNTPLVQVDSRNSTYIIENKPVTLINGFAEEEITPGSASKIITRYFGNEALGDLNNDNQEDAAFLLSQDGGGSGTFYYVAALLYKKDGTQGTNAIFLGDRIAPQATEIREGKIIVNYADRKPGEPMSAQPSVGVSKYFKIEGGILVELKEKN